MSAAEKVPDHDELLSMVERHLSENKIAPSAFGRTVANDPNLILDMRAGREFRKPLRRKIAEAIGG